MTRHLTAKSASQGSILLVPERRTARYAQAVSTTATVLLLPATMTVWRTAQVVPLAATCRTKQRLGSTTTITTIAGSVHQGKLRPIQDHQAAARATLGSTRIRPPPALSVV